MKDNLGLLHFMDILVCDVAMTM